MARNLAIYSTLFFLLFCSASVVDGQNPEPTQLKGCAGNSSNRAFYWEEQPDSPILIRDLNATFKRDDSGLSSDKGQVTVRFYFENRAGKKVRDYSYQNVPTDGSDYYDEAGWGGELLAGESKDWLGTMAAQGAGLIFRVSRVKFTDGSEWRANRFAKSARVLGPICPETEALKSNATLKNLRVLPRQGWMTFPLADRVTKVIVGDEVTIDGMVFTTNLHEIKSERLTSVESCQPENDAYDLNQEFGRDFDVDRYSSYQVNGRTFAYRMSYELVDAKQQSRIGAGHSVIYVDEKGDGVYKLQCDGWEKPILPKWVKEAAATRRKTR